MELQPDHHAITAFEAIHAEYKEYLKYAGECKSPELLMDHQAKIQGHIFFLAKPLAYHRRKAREKRAEYESAMRRKRNELLKFKRVSSVSAAESEAKAEFAEIAAESERHEGLAEELQVLYDTCDSARYIISQDLKVTTRETASAKITDAYLP